MCHFSHERAGDVIDVPTEGTLERIYNTYSGIVGPTAKVEVLPPPTSSETGGKSIPFNVLAMVERLLYVAQHIISLEATALAWDSDHEQQFVADLADRLLQGGEAWLRADAFAQSALQSNEVQTEGNQLLITQTS